MSVRVREIESKLKSEKWIVKRKKKKKKDKLLDGF